MPSAPQQQPHASGPQAPAATRGAANQDRTVVQFSATFGPGLPMTFVDTVSRMPLMLPNGQQAFVLQVQDGALVSPLHAGLPFGQDVLATSPGDWVVGGDLDAVVSRLLDAYVPPVRSVAEEAIASLPRRRVAPHATPERASAAAGAAAAAAVAQPPTGRGVPEHQRERVAVRLEAAEETVRLRLAAGAEAGSVGEGRGAERLRVALEPDAAGGAVRLRLAAAAEARTEAVAAAARPQAAEAAGASTGVVRHAACAAGEVCTVCHDAFEAGAEVVELPCRHCFHEDCIVPWLRQQDTCPVCRTRIKEHHPGRRQPPHLHQHRQQPAAGARAETTAAAGGAPSPAPAAQARVPGPAHANRLMDFLRQRGVAVNAPPAAAAAPTAAAAAAAAAAAGAAGAGGLRGIRPPPGLTSEALSAAEAAFAAMATRFQPLVLGDQAAMPPLDVMLGLGTRGAAAQAGRQQQPAQQQQQQQQSAQRGAQARPGAQPAGAPSTALRGGFFNSGGVNLYGNARSGGGGNGSSNSGSSAGGGAGAPAPGAGAGRGSVLRSGFLNSSAAPGAPRAGGASGPSLPPRRQAPAQQAEQGTQQGSQPSQPGAQAQASPRGGVTVQLPLPMLLSMPMPPQVAAALSAGARGGARAPLPSEVADSLPAVLWGMGLSQAADWEGDVSEPRQAASHPSPSSTAYASAAPQPSSWSTAYASAAPQPSSWSTAYASAAPQPSSSSTAYASAAPQPPTARSPPGGPHGDRVADGVSSAAPGEVRLVIGGIPVVIRGGAEHGASGGGNHGSGGGPDALGRMRVMTAEGADASLERAVAAADRRGGARPTDAQLRRVQRRALQNAEAMLRTLLSDPRVMPRVAELADSWLQRALGIVRRPPAADAVTSAAAAAGAGTATAGAAPAAVGSADSASAPPAGAAGDPAERGRQASGGGGEEGEGGEGPGPTRQVARCRQSEDAATLANRLEGREEAAQPPAVAAFTLGAGRAAGAAVAAAAPRRPRVVAHGRAAAAPRAPARRAPAAAAAAAAAGGAAAASASGARQQSGGQEGQVPSAAAQPPVGPSAPAAASGAGGAGGGAGRGPGVNPVALLARGAGFGLRLLGGAALGVIRRGGGRRGGGGQGGDSAAAAGGGES